MTPAEFEESNPKIARLSGDFDCVEPDFPPMHGSQRE